MSNFYFNRPLDRVAGTPSVQSGTEQVGYESVYLTDWSDNNAQRPALLNETSGAWKVHFGSSQRIDLVALQHNFDAGLPCNFRGGGTFGSPTLISPFTIPARRADSFSLKVWADLRSVSGYSALGFTDWWLDVTGTNSVPIGAKLWLGTIIRTLTRDFGLTSIPEGETPASIVLSTDAGPVWGYDLNTNPRQFTGIQNFGTADITDLRDWHRACGGRGQISGMIPDITKQDFWVVRWVNGVTRDSDGLVKPVFAPPTVQPALSSITVTLDEVTAGLPEWE